MSTPLAARPVPGMADLRHHLCSHPGCRVWVVEPPGPRRGRPQKRCTLHRSDGRRR